MILSRNGGELVQQQIYRRPEFRSLPPLGVEIGEDGLLRERFNCRRC